MCRFLQFPLGALEWCFMREEKRKIRTSACGQAPAFSTTVSKQRLPTFFLLFIFKKMRIHNQIIFVNQTLFQLFNFLLLIQKNQVIVHGKFKVFFFSFQSSKLYHIGSLSCIFMNCFFNYSNIFSFI